MSKKYLTIKLFGRQLNLILQKKTIKDEKITLVEKETVISEESELAEVLSTISRML